MKHAVTGIEEAKAILRKKVDLVMKAAISPELMDRILRGVVYL